MSIKCTGLDLVAELINIGYGIRACWVEKIMKINKCTPTFITYSRVSVLGVDGVREVLIDAAQLSLS